MDRRQFLHAAISLAALAGPGSSAVADNRSGRPRFTRRQINSGGMSPRSIELFVVSPDTAAPAGAMLFVHGHQGGRDTGGRGAVDDGTLWGICSALNITAASVSKPCYGASEGPPDFCGPATQQAIIAALNFLRLQPNVDPDRIVLNGYSRGAIASAMVAPQDVDLRALILVSGIYDLKTAYETARPGIRLAIEREAGVTAGAFASRSALFHVGKIRSETLLLHGRSDDRAPIEQAEKMASALSDVGVKILGVALMRDGADVWAG